jgi:hypothetical protein
MHLFWGWARLKIRSLMLVETRVEASLYMVLRATRRLEISSRKLAVKGKSKSKSNCKITFD